MAEKENLEQEKRNEDLLNYHSSNVPSEWQLTGTDLSNAPIGLISSGNSIPVCKGDILEQPSCSNSSIIDSFCPTMWDQPSSSHNLGFTENNVQHNSCILNPLGNRTGCLVSLRGGIDSTIGMGWTPPNTMLKGGMFLPGIPGFLPQSLAHIPTDSGLAPMLGSQETLTGNGLKSMSGIQSQNQEMNNAESSKHVSLLALCVASDGNQFKNEKNSDNLVMSHDEAKGGVGVSGNESDEAEFSGRGAQEEPEGAGGESSSKAAGSKKRKRCGQDTEFDRTRGSSHQAAEVREDDKEVQQKGNQNPTSVSGKPGSRNGKQGPEASDSPKEEYIHVRARRGQATNSHSLAERVRREKISQRMKFLQDLVPGCSKVTGKAVMLDEIINYVQSLQRQIEFLSMKLATVNPRIDFNIEGLLAKDILQPRAGPSCSLAFPPDISMTYPLLHQSQQGLGPAGLHGIGNSSDAHALRRSINSQLATASGSFKELSSHVPNVWEDELHN